ncbi:MAG TPA: hypothetical protein VHF44_03235 [Nitrososphaeraceae archaeon]|nr:hypothetical protein [Nitrososphaeraceae archaeon]
MDQTIQLIYSSSTGSKSGATPATTAISDFGSLLLPLLSHGMF